MEPRFSNRQTIQTLHTCITYIAQQKEDWEKKGCVKWEQTERKEHGWWNGETTIHLEALPYETQHCSQVLNGRLGRQLSGKSLAVQTQCAAFMLECPEPTWGQLQCACSPLGRREAEMEPSERTGQPVSNRRGCQSRKQKPAHTMVCTCSHTHEHTRVLDT